VAGLTGCDQCEECYCHQCITRCSTCSSGVCDDSSFCDPHSHCALRGTYACDPCRVNERAHLRATTILCLEQYEGGAPVPAEGGVDGAIAARHYCKDVWSVILSYIEPGQYDNPQPSP
jgi:hypothetical protein